MFAANQTRNREGAISTLGLVRFKAQCWSEDRVCKYDLAQSMAERQMKGRLWTLSVPMTALRV